MTSAARRFYKHAAVAESEAGYGVALDARALRTPGGAPFVVPTRALAESCAAEWDAQGEHILPSSMPLTQLAFAALDATPERRAELARSVAKYIETDLVCHRADAPAALVEHQAAHWDPLVAWAGQRLHMRLPVVTGIAPAEVPPQFLTVLEWEVDDLDDFRRTALAQAAALAGSAVIGFALLEGRLDAAQAYAAAALDEEWSMQRWGEDREARSKLDRQRAEFENVARFIALLGD